MGLGRLTDLQARVLAILAPVQPPWTLTGGGALCGFHLRHRTTRDVDLFWHGLRAFAREPEQCVGLLQQAGLQVDVVQRAPAFARLRCSSGTEAVVVDLVAEPVAVIEAPQLVQADRVTIRVDTPHEIFVNKLGALLHRSELRDLVDLRALLEQGADLARGLRDAAAKDSGFSPLTVAHLLHVFPIEKQAPHAGVPATSVRELMQFRDQLEARIAALAQP